MITLRPSESRDASRILEIWSKAVDATHGFLLPADRVAIGEEVEAFLPQAPLTLAVDVSDRPLGFMFLHEGHMEALFIDPDHHGQGIGKVLVQRALALHPALTRTSTNRTPGPLVFTAGWDSNRRDAPISTDRGDPIRSFIFDFAQRKNRPQGSSGRIKPRTP